MQNINLTFSKTGILEEVSLNTAYAGAKTATDKDSFDRIATINEDEELLKRFLSEAMGGLADMLRGLITSVEETTDAVSFNLELSGSYDSTQTSSLIADLFSSLAAGVTGRWFRFTFPHKAPEWEDKSAELLSRALRKLYYRKKPRRQAVNGD